MSVHNHGTEEGLGLACREIRVPTGALVGECQIFKKEATFTGISVPIYLRDPDPEEDEVHILRDLPVYGPSRDGEPQPLAAKAEIHDHQIIIDLEDRDSSNNMVDILKSMQDITLHFAYRPAVKAEDPLNWAIDLLEHMKFYTERNLEIGTPIEQIADDGNLYLRDRNVLIGSKDASGGEKNFDYDKASKGERALWALEQFRVITRLSPFYKETLVERFLVMAKQILG